MKKTKISLALIFAISATAHAQSNVILYGVLDMPIQYVNHQAGSAPVINATTGAVTQQSGGNRFSLQSTGGLAGSRWGIRGTEDLGGGLKAVFALESGFGVDDGNSLPAGRLFGRQAFIGLQHQSFGTLTFGRQYTTLFDAFSNFGPLVFAPLYEPVTVMLGQALREDNTIKYTGVFGNITAEAHWSFGAGAGTLGLTPLAGGGTGEVPSHFRDNTGYGAALSYFSGPFGATVAYDQWNPAVAVGNPGSVKKAGAALSYRLGATTVLGGFRWNDNKDSSGTTLVRDDLYWLGVNYQATSALGLNLAYYYDNLKMQRVASTAPGFNPSNPWQISFMTNYRFSKRTDIYFTMAYAKNSGLNLDTSSNFATGYYLSQGNTSQFGAAMGVRHTF